MKYTCVKQHDSKDCGVACLSSICTHNGLRLPLVKYKELTKSDNMGTNILGLVDAGKKLGFQTEALNGSFDDLLKEIEQKRIVLPSIAHVIINKNFEHFVVIYEIKKDKIVIADPASGIVTKDIQTFLLEWTGNIITYEKTDKFVEDKKEVNLFTFFVKNIPSKKKMIALILLFSAFSSVIGIITSMLYSMLIDGVVLGDYKNTTSVGMQLSSLTATKVLLIIALTAVFLELLKLTFNILRGKLVAKLSVIFDTAIIGKYYEHLLSLPIHFFSTKKTGELISRFNDAIKIRTALMSILLSVTLDLVMVLCGGFFMYRISSKLFFLGLVIACAFLIVMYSFKERINKLEKKVMNSNGLVTSYLKETISGIETIKIFQLELPIFKLFKNIWDQNQDASYKGSVTDNTRFSLVTFISTTGALCMYVFGVLEILQGRLSIGILVSYTTLTSYFLSPFTNIVNLQTEVQSASVALERLGDVLFSEVEKKETGIELCNLTEDIHFKNVSFRYGNRSPVLKNVSFTIPKNQHISLIGESGSGKSTIAKLLLNLYTQESGEIRIGNINIKAISIQYLRKKIAMVSQSSFFFNESIMDNLRKANSDLADEEIRAVCQDCGIDSFIMGLPMQYDSILEEGGKNLSGGQRQLLSIVRALLKQPDILILDEATSNLDSHSEEMINRIISTMDITCLVIAHRLKNVVHSDQIIVLKNGEINSIGTHEELLKTSTLYTEMIDKQRIK